MSDLDTYFTQFVRQKVYLRNVTPKTREWYETAWKAFCRYRAAAPPRLPVAALIGRSDLQSFGVDLRERGVKPVSSNSSPFEGLYALGILNIVYMLGMLRSNVGLLVVHRHTNPISAGFALLLSVLARGISISSNEAVPLLELAQEHAVAPTDAQRWAFVATNAAG